MTGGTLKQLATAVIVSLTAAACASTAPSSFGDGDLATGGRIERPATPLECAPYARARSGIPIYGDAYTWWDQAAGHYLRSTGPKRGAVLVLDRYAGPTRAHLAVVRTVSSSRRIRVDHANWLDDGAIYLNDPVMDVSPDNDWSVVRVFNLSTGAWGGRIYPVRGFIGPEGDGTTVARNSQ